ncbi:MAG: hypothetical protein KF712_18005 [Akkermansiaceae bacterium]|nr:hypothetical protein [Akkermansiaceae bacterium]
MKEAIEIMARILAAVAIPVLIIRFSRAAGQPGRTNGDRTWLEYGRGIRIFTALLGVLVLWLIGLWIFSGPEQRFDAMMLVLIFGSLAIPLVLEVFWVRIGCDGSTLWCFSPWRRNREIPLEEMGTPYYSALMKWWVIPTRRHGKVRVSDFLAGRDAFLRRLGVRTTLG